MKILLALWSIDGMNKAPVRAALKEPLERGCGWGATGRHETVPRTGYFRLGADWLTGCGSVGFWAGGPTEFPEYVSSDGRPGWTKLGGRSAVCMHSSMESGCGTLLDVRGLL